MERLRILLSGMVAGDPEQGGATWAVLQYLLGLRALGHDVMLVEPVEAPTERTVRYFRRLVRDFDLGDRAALLVPSDGSTVGVPYRRLREAARASDLLLNISGMLRDEELCGPPPLRCFLDLDPGFNQLWAAGGLDLGFGRHNRFATVGLALGGPDCRVPTDGRPWVTTLPPVFLPGWPLAGAPPAGAAYTTIGHWRSYGSITWKGEQYGQRAHSLRELIDLPGRTSEAILLALAIHPDEADDIAALDRHGWRRVDPAAVAASPAAYARFIRGSKGELGVAKSGYVRSRCGWFSDRSAAYLASGRPVVAQDTGFAVRLPPGPGLRSFTTAAEAADALERISVDYRTEAAAARRLAEQELDSTRVLTRLLESIA